MPEQSSKALLAQIEKLIAEQDFDTLREVLAHARTSDVAEVVEVVDNLSRVILFDLLDAKEAGEVLEKVDDATRSEVAEELPREDLSDMVATLPPDEAADVVADLTEEKGEQVLQDIGKAESDQIEKLLSYDEDTAGGIMNPDLVKVPMDATIGDALEQLRKADPDEEFFYVFVVDKNDKYMGMIGLRALLYSSPDTPVAQVLETDIPCVGVNADQEEIANTFRKNDLMVMPVVDENGVLVGRITSDDIIDVMDEEAEEDVLVMAGTHPDELDTHQIVRAAAIRLPWLLVCIGGEMLTALMLYPLYQDHFPVAVWMCMVTFVPAIAAAGGNSGLQTSTTVVRGLATGDLAALKIGQVFLRESRVAAVVAVCCGTLSGVVAAGWSWLRSVEGLAWDRMGLAVGLAMFCGIMLCTTLGVVLPFTFRRIGLDPAICSGPLITTTNDALGMLTYFTLAFVLLRMMT